MTQEACTTVIMYFSINGLQEVSKTGRRPEPLAMKLASGSIVVAIVSFAIVVFATMQRLTQIVSFWLRAQVLFAVFRGVA